MIADNLKPNILHLALLAAITLLLRIAVFYTASTTGHIALSSYTAKADSASYIAYATAMCGERSFNSLEEYDRRVFPGYPALIAVVHKFGISLPMSALITTWTCAAFSAAATGALFADRRVGYAMVCLIPHYLINSSLAMSEAPLLAAMLAGLLLGHFNRPLLAGIVLCFAVLIRPMGCFAVAGILLMAVVQRRWKFGFILSLAVLLTFASGVAALQRWTGDALQGTRIYAHNPGAYNGHLFLWPFQSLLATPFQEPTTVGRIIYTWIHVIITLGACAMVTHKVLKMRSTDARDLIAFPWLLGNTLFVLCIGSAWGFRHFPRFTIPAAPAMFWTLRHQLPRNRAVWLLIVMACFAAAVVGVRNSP